MGVRQVLGMQDSLVCVCACVCVCVCVCMCVCVCVCTGRLAGRLISAGKLAFRWAGRSMGRTAAWWLGLQDVCARLSMAVTAAVFV
jgi:hypothetical protein